MQLKDVNESLNHQISGGSEYDWQCYGANARFLDYTSSYATSSCVFDTLTQEIYEVHVEFTNSEKRPYRWLNPNTKQTMYDESAYREIDADQAWDDVKWIDLETEEDFLQKASAIFKGETFDTRVSVPLDLTDEELFAMMKLAHEKDITLNQLMVEIMQAVIDSTKNTVDE